MWTYHHRDAKRYAAGNGRLQVGHHVWSGGTEFDVLVIGDWEQQQAAGV
jgi:hypothetical protein